MRARTEAALAIGALTLLALLVGVLARPGTPATVRDERPSTFLATPGGSRGLLEAVRGLGIAVRRFRERPRQLEARLSAGGRQVLVISGPTFRFSPPERDLVLAFQRQADLLLAGTGAESLMRCFGYRVRQRPFDSLRTAPPGRAPAAAAARVGAFLEATREREAVDSTRADDVGQSRCVVPPLRSVDTLLLGSGERLVGLRLRRADLDRDVVLLADAELLRNRALRHTDAGPFALRLFQGRYDRVIFEEYHHGFGTQGSLAGATLAWSRRSPWGWLVWQLAAVGLLALLFGAIRFGPVRPAIARTRRSPLEHVRALATALSAARGHDQAIGAIVRGLQRRLAPAGLRPRGHWRDWLTGLDRPATPPGVKASLGTLVALTRPEQPSESVLQAANAVEDVWQQLRP